MFWHLALAYVCYQKSLHHPKSTGSRLQTPDRAGKSSPCSTGMGECGRGVDRAGWVEARQIGPRSGWDQWHQHTPNPIPPPGLECTMWGFLDLRQLFGRCRFEKPHWSGWGFTPHSIYITLSVMISSLPLPSARYSVGWEASLPQRWLGMGCEKQSSMQIGILVLNTWSYHGQIMFNLYTNGGTFTPTNVCHSILWGEDEEKKALNLGTLSWWKDTPVKANHL